ncbi:unnamed protein product [Gordionus sp. m RMFG-2023]
MWHYCIKIKNLAGLLEEDLERIENAIGYNLPLDFRCSYRIRNGQRLNAPGILGSMEIGTHYISEALLDLETLIQPAIWWHIKRNLRKIWNLKATGTVIQARSSLKGCLPVTVCVSTGVSQYMALSSEDGHIPGSLFYPVDDRRISNLSGDKDVFLTAINFQDWLTAHADKLKRSQYPIIKNEIYRFLPDPLNTTSTTNHIKVSVATCFCPELSSVNPPRFFYTYRITMTMDSNAPKNDMYRLSSRHWLITDSEGREERVDGPGVVGEYPLMFAGTTYSWVSCTTFKTRVGYMQGYFSMVKLNESNNFAHGFSINQLIENKNSVFKVTCPKFRMVCSLSITAGQRRVGITNLSIIGNTDNDGDSDMDDAIGFQYDYDDNN